MAMIIASQLFAHILHRNKSIQLFLDFYSQMFSPRGDYVTLIKSVRNRSIEQARQAYLGQKFVHNNKRPNLYNNIRTQSHGKAIQNTDRLDGSHRSQSNNTTALTRKKFKTLSKNNSSDRISKHQRIETSVRKSDLSMDCSQKDHEDNMKKNQLGENCRICILAKGKTITEYFLTVDEASEINKFLREKERAHFVTVPRQISLEVAMASEKISGKFLNGQSIYLKPEPKLPLFRGSIGLKDFQLIRPIGSGGFSQVFLSRSKIDNKFYALKMIEKEMIMRNKKQKLVMNERNIMANCNHPFVVEFKHAFECEKFLVFVMEYCGGGQLFGLIKKYHRLHEETAKFYIIEIFLGLQHLHSQKVVYRDIKPENILLGADGHVKIADLGLAKPNMEERKLAYSFCGSPEYMSPQMIMQVGHTYPVDYYCMGALLYQLLTGLPPFYNQDPEQIYQAVVSQELQFSEEVTLTPECKSLIKSLLCKDPKHRLGALCGIKEILAHPWFGKQNFQKYLNKEIKPPTSFNTIKHFASAVDTELNEKNKKVLQTFLKDQKKQRTDFSPLLKNFEYSEQKQENSEIEEINYKQKKSERHVKIPLIYSAARKNQEKENQTSGLLNLLMNKNSSRGRKNPLLHQMSYR